MVIKQIIEDNVIYFLYDEKIKRNIYLLAYIKKKRIIYFKNLINGFRMILKYIKRNVVKYADSLGNKYYLYSPYFNNLFKKFNYETK